MVWNFCRSVDSPMIYFKVRLYLSDRLERAHDPAPIRSDVASRQEGRQEEKVTIALNMLRGNIAPDVVAEVTGLTIAQIQQLQTSNSIQ
jgi:hypothetical protein